MADIRDCEQCGTSFVPRREHARFCSARCRAAWNREHVGDPKAGASALVWSITAMSDTTDRLTRVRAADRPRAFTVISEAVWWVTMVDATLVRHHPDAYDGVLAGQSPASASWSRKPWRGCVLSGTRSATKPTLLSSSSPASPVMARKEGVSRAGHGGQCPNRRLRRFHRAGRRGRRRGTGPTRLTWRAAPSGRPSAGPRRSLSWPPRTHPPSPAPASRPDAESAVPRAG